MANHLIEAAKNNNFGRVKFLINTGMSNIKMSKQNEYGCTALHYASFHGNLKIVKLLIESGMSNANNNILEKKDNQGDTALHCASMRGHLQIAKLLIKSGMSNGNTHVSEKNNAGYTPLHWASYWGHFEIVKLLVKSGSDIEAVNDVGKTAIDLTKTKEIKDFLIEQLEIQKNGGYLLK